MLNHYHVLVYLEHAGLSQAMKSLSLAYTKAINKRFNRVGSLFQGQFQKIRVTDSGYLVHLIQYIHLNPVKANLVKQPEEWEFSSYLEYARLRADTLPRMELVQQQFDDGMFLEEGGLPNSLAFRRLLLDD